jgi:hypothetical protein
MQTIDKLCCLAVLFVLLWAGNAAANTRQHLFYISKSENRNQVHYAISLDDRCMPVGNTPVYAYWQMLEKGPNITEWLLDREQGAYGIGRQNVRGGTVSFSLNSLPNRTITISTSMRNGVCTVKTTAYIAGEQAVLDHIHADLWLFGISKITLHGYRVRDNVKVEEVMR